MSKFNLGRPLRRIKIYELLRAGDLDFANPDKWVVRAFATLETDDEIAA